MLNRLSFLSENDAPFSYQVVFLQLFCKQGPPWFAD